MNMEPGMFVDEMVLNISQYNYPVVGSDQFKFVLPEQGAAAVDLLKPRRRRNRKKSKGGDGGAAMRGKRKLTEEQVSMLEESFGSDRKLESERKERLAAELGLDGRQVAVWFQNRRARWKSRMVEEECSKLRAEHEATAVENRRLEAEVLKLRVQLEEAEKEIQKITKEWRSGGLWSSSPSSSLSMETIEPFSLGDFGMEGLDHLINYIHGLEWANNIYYI